MPRYNPRYSAPANSKDTDPDDPNDEPEPDTSEAALPDDIERPKGLVNFDQAPFGGLCGLFDVLESANREGHKKPGFKGNLIAKFFAVSTSPKLQGRLGRH